MKTIEYRVRPVVRYLVTKFECGSENQSVGSSVVGEFDNESNAWAVQQGLELLAKIPPPLCAAEARRWEDHIADMQAIQQSRNMTSGEAFRREFNREMANADRAVLNAVTGAQTRA